MSRERRRVSAADVALLEWWRAALATGEARVVRQDAGVTVTAVADMIRAQIGYVSKLELGKRRPTARPETIRLARFYRQLAEQQGRV